MKKQWIGLLLVIMTIAACNDPKDEKIKALKTNAIEVHDEVMPRIGEIGELSRDFGARRKALLNDSSDSALAVRLELGRHIDSLDMAYDAMMDWMDQFEPSMDEQVEKDSAIAYYEAQLKAIEEVKRKMNSSLANAKSLDQ